MRLTSETRGGVFFVDRTPGGAVWWETCQFFFDPNVVASLNARLARPDELPPAWTAVPWWRNDA